MAMPLGLAQLLALVPSVAPGPLAAGGHAASPATLLAQRAATSAKLWK
jgi:hypothetical protein